MAINFPNSPAPNEIYTFNGLSWRWTGSSWTSLGTAVIGATGATGATGPQGPTGATGAAGATGSQGIQGPTGAAGATGSQGIQGPTGATGSQGPQGNTGNTGATGPVGDYVISLMGLTGAVGLTNGSGIGLSVSGNTLTFSNTGVLSFNGLTGAVTGVTTGTANTFGPLQSFTNGISASGATFARDISINSVLIGLGSGNCGSNLVFGAGAYTSGSGFTGKDNIAVGLNALASNRAGDVNVGIGRNALTSNTNGRNNTAIGAYALSTLNGVTWGSGFGEYNVAVGGNALFNATTASYNMAIGASSLSNNTSGFENVAIGTFALFRNNTGNDNVAIGHQALGPGFGTPNTLTENVSIGWNSLFNTNTTSHNVAIGPQVGFSNTTGASNTLIGRRALYNGVTGSNTVAIGAQAGEFAGTTTSTLTNSNGSIFIGQSSRSANQTSTNEIVIGNNAVGLGNNTTVIGGTTQTSATIYGLLNAPGGLSAAGGTFGGNLRLQNGEFLQNTTNGRMDFMPAPSGSTHYGLYVDMTSWGFGPALGTIRSSDNALNNAQIRWDVPLVMGNDVNFSFGANQQNLFRLSSTGNDTVQFATNVTTGTNSAALALVDAVGLGAANRSPGVTHSNPNLYVYRAGAASANDFMRFEHDGNNGRIISGGTSGIIIEPGSGILGISGGVSGGYGLNANSFGLTSGFDIIPASWDSITAPMGAPGTVANRLYLVAISIPSRCTIKTFATQQGTSSGGNTGNIFLGLYNTNIYGLPQNLVAQSPSQALTTTNFAVIRASNINYTANPGNYWLAICFSAGGLSGGIGRPGPPMKYITATSSSPIAQAMNWGLYVTQSGFTLSTSLSGATFTAITSNTDFPGIFYTAEGL